jgi:hypothetical protein
VVPLAICVCIGTAPILKNVLPWLVGAGFEGTLLPTWILLLAVPLAYWLRLMANVLLAAGAARVYAFSAGARLLSVVAVLALSEAPGLQTAAIAWAIGEVTAVLICMLGLVYALGWSLGEVVGVSRTVVAQDV